MPSSLQTIVIGGEVCPSETVRQWAEKYKLINVYGPTEATICSSIIQCNAQNWAEPYLGTALPFVTYRVFDNAYNDVPVGMEGELYISGPVLARGYLGKPDLTASKFVTLKDIRYYKTGDRVKVSSDGNHAFCGRIDRQFKIRGQLVEPEEVEACISGFHHISRIAVIKRALIPSDPDAPGVLVAFIQTDDNQPFNSALLRHYVEDKLPPWMIPQKFLYIEKMPETTSGKIDYQKLLDFPIILPDHATKDYSPTMVKLADLIARILRIPRPSPEDEFYILGGDSLSALELIVAAEKEGIRLYLSHLAQRLSIRDLASDIDTALLPHVSQLYPTGAIAATFLNRDARLSPDVRQKMILINKVPPFFDGQIQNILVTGASGFLGSRLLFDLLTSTNAHIYCLMQATSREHARLKLQTSSMKFGVDGVSGNWYRITPICGNIAHSDLGMTETEWRELSHKIDVIYHCAATVNMMSSYEELKETNLGGTENILRFALEGKRKQINYASTLSVFVATDHNSGIVYEADNLDSTRWIYGGYAQTKWAAERLIRQVADILPINIFRFGFITGDTHNPIDPDNSWLKIFIKGIASIGCIPAQALDGLYMDLTPRDYATSSMVAIATKQWGKPSQTYHIANLQSTNLRALIKAMIDVGCVIESVTEDVWRARVQSLHMSPEHAAAILSLCQATEETSQKDRNFDLFQASDIIFDQRNVAIALQNIDISGPQMTPDLLRMYVRNMLDRN